MPVLLLPTAQEGEVEIVDDPENHLLPALATELPRVPLARNLDRVVASALAAMPGQVAHFLIWDRDDPNAMLVSVGKTIDANPADNRIVRVDAHTAAFLDAPDVTGRSREAGSAVD